MTKKMTKVTAAINNLLRDHPFYGFITLQLERVETRDIPTAATDGRRLIYNPDFIDGLTINEVMFVLAHEVHHVFLNDTSAEMMRDKDHALWNVACDVRINYELDVMSVGKRPACGIWEPDLYHECGGFAQRIYDKLLQRAKQQRREAGGGSGSLADTPGIPGAGSQRMDELLPSPADPAEAAQREMQRKRMIAGAAQQARAAGRLPAMIANRVERILHPKARWQDVLRRFMTEPTRDDYGWAKFRRPFSALPNPIYLPGRVGYGLGRVVIAVDTSGSVTHCINRFAAEMRGICEDAQPASVEVLYFDSEVKRHDSFESPSDLTINAVGGGGTSFDPVWRAVDEMQDVACVVMLTDMLPCDGFGTPPAVPVLFASVSGIQQAPFGEVVDIRD